jgi:hypothetical protein
MTARLVEIVGFDASAIKDRQELIITLLTPTRGPDQGKRLLKLSSGTSEFLTVQVKADFDMNTVLQSVQIMVELESE